MENVVNYIFRIRVFINNVKYRWLYDGWTIDWQWLCLVRIQESQIFYIQITELQNDKLNGTHPNELLCI